MKALITGSEGFVGKYLRAELEAHGYDVTGLDLAPGEKTVAVNLLEAEKVGALLEELQPEVIFHLAGQANVGLSWKKPVLTMEINLIAAVNLMDANTKKQSCYKLCFRVYVYFVLTLQIRFSPHRNPCTDTASRK